MNLISLRPHALADWRVQLSLRAVKPLAVSTATAAWILLYLLTGPRVPATEF
jgi:hypothetical protein